LLTHRKAAVVQELSSLGEHRHLCPLARQPRGHTHDNAKLHQPLPCFRNKTKQNKTPTNPTTTTFGACQNRQCCTDLSSFEVLKAFYKGSKKKMGGEGTP